MKWRILVAGMLATSLGVTGAVAARTGLIETGKPFPDLVLPSAEDGSPLSIASFRGEKVIVQIFASW